MTGKAMDGKEEIAPECILAGGQQVLAVPAAGPPLASEQDALDLIGLTYGMEVQVIAVPVARFAPEVFRLRTGLLGAFLQKLCNYRFRVAIIGALSGPISRSTALRDFVVESNRRGDVLFVADFEALAARL